MEPQVFRRRREVGPAAACRSVRGEEPPVQLGQAGALLVDQVLAVDVVQTHGFTSGIDVQQQRKVVKSFADLERLVFFELPVHRQHRDGDVGIFREDCQGSVPVLVVLGKHARREAGAHRQTHRIVACRRVGAVEGSQTPGAELLLDPRQGFGHLEPAAGQFPQLAVDQLEQQRPLAEPVSERLEECRGGVHPGGQQPGRLVALHLVDVDGAGSRRQGVAIAGGDQQR